MSTFLKMYHFSNQHRFLITATEIFTVLTSNYSELRFFLPTSNTSKEKEHPTNQNPRTHCNCKPLPPDLLLCTVCFIICGKLNLRTAGAQQNSGIACAYRGAGNAFHTFKLFHVLRTPVRATAAISSHSNSTVQINHSNLHIIGLPKYHRKFYVQQRLSHSEALGCVLCIL